MAIPFWVLNLSQERLDAMEARWSSALTQAQLGNPWQQVKLDGQALPGLWKLKKVKRQLRAQANKKSGGDGGSATIRGLLNPNFMLEGGLFIPSHLSAWVDLVPKLDVTGDPSARGQHLIEHPLAAMSGVRAVLVLDVEYTAPEGGGGLGVTLGLLGVNERDGATVRPKNKAVPTATVPKIDIPRAGTAPNVADVYKIKPPGPSR